MKERKSPYMNAEQAAEYLGYASLRSLYKAVSKSGIPHYKRAGRTLLFLPAELDRWLLAGTTRRGRASKPAAPPRLR